MLYTRNQYNDMSTFSQLKSKKYTWNRINKIKIREQMSHICAYTHTHTHTEKDCCRVLKNSVFGGRKLAEYLTKKYYKRVSSKTVSMR